MDVQAETSEQNSTVEFRDASEGDYPALLRLTLTALGSPELARDVSKSDAHPFHRFARQHGRVLVAEVEDEIAGYGSVVQHGSSRILSQLFVSETLQSRSIGRKLLKRIDPADRCDRLLLATGDPRAIALYVRRGYVPGWPVFTVQVPSQVIERLPKHDALARRMVVGKRIADLDRGTSGLNRPEVHRYWESESGGELFEIFRGKVAIGFGWIHDPAKGSLSRWHRDDPALEVGPVGALQKADAEVTVLALLEVVQNEYPGRDAVIEIGGPHPALPALLQVGARITESELAMSTNRSAFGEPDRYVPSGGILY